VSKRIRELKRKLQRLDADLRVAIGFRGNSHYRVTLTHPERGRQDFTMANSPSCPRGDLNDFARIRRWLRGDDDMMGHLR
jgi:hypothetical protein